MTSSIRRANKIRDRFALALLVSSVLVPLNIFVSATSGSAWVVVLFWLTLALSLGSVAATHVGPLAVDGEKPAQPQVNRIRLVLNLPYLALLAGIVVFAVVQSLRLGGDTAVPPGVGPGVWLGLAGSLMAAAPVFTESGVERRNELLFRTIAIASVLLATVAMVSTLYWRTRFVAPNIADADSGTQNLIVAVAAVLYGVVALLPIILGARWIASPGAAARRVVVLLGVSTVIAGVFVGLLPVGRELDAFHGIAASTSTAGVGFEGYIAWVLAAALAASSLTLTIAGRSSMTAWRGAARKGLLLIAVWCCGSAILRITDLMMSSVLDLPAPPYYATALMAFDLVVAVVAAWLFVNTSSESAPGSMLKVGYLVLLALAVCRVVIGVALVPRSQPLNPSAINEVYGNTLTQQITSTFDVALCVLALAALLIAVEPRIGAKTKPAPTDPVSDREATEIIPAAEPVESAPDTADQSMWAPSAATTPAYQTVRIARLESDEVAGSDRVNKVLAESTQRFAAGTTYGRSGPV